MQACDWLTECEEEKIPLESNSLNTAKEDSVLISQISVSYVFHSHTSMSCSRNAMLSAE